MWFLSIYFFLSCTKFPVSVFLWVFDFIFIKIAFILLIKTVILQAIVNKCYIKNIMIYFRLLYSLKVSSNKTCVKSFDCNIRNKPLYGQTLTPQLSVGSWNKLCCVERAPATKVLIRTQRCVLAKGLDGINTHWATALH